MMKSKHARKPKRTYFPDLSPMKQIEFTEEIGGR